MSLSKIDYYNAARTQRYVKGHRKSLRSRLTTASESRSLFRSLAEAGYPSTVLDLPCGTGRFWPTFQRAGVKRLLAADGSQNMLEVAATHRLSETLPAELLQTSAFNIELPTASVDFVACLRFYHHLARPEDREVLLRELMRVSKRFVALSLWVDGNFLGNRKIRKPRHAVKPGYGRRICRRRDEVEAEFISAGFTIRGHYDNWPRIHMWRLYLLESVEPAVSDSTQPL